MTKTATRSQRSTSGASTDQTRAGLASRFIDLKHFGSSLSAVRIIASWREPSTPIRVMRTISSELQ
jgi:hypothetical protein